MCRRTNLYSAYLYFFVHICIYLEAEWKNLSCSCPWKHRVSNKCGERCDEQSDGAFVTLPQTKNTHFPQSSFVGRWTPTLSRAGLTPVYDSLRTLTPCFYSLDPHWVAAVTPVVTFLTWSSGRCVLAAACDGQWVGAVTQRWKRGEVCCISTVRCHLGQLIALTCKVIRFCSVDFMTLFSSMRWPDSLDFTFTVVASLRSWACNVAPTLSSLNTARTNTHDHTLWVMVWKVHDSQGVMSCMCLSSCFNSLPVPLMKPHWGRLLAPGLAPPGTAPVAATLLQEASVQPCTQTMGLRREKRPFCSQVYTYMTTVLCIQAIP